MTATGFRDRGPAVPLIFPAADDMASSRLATHLVQRHGVDRADVADLGWGSLNGVHANRQRRGIFTTPDDRHTHGRPT